MERKNPECVLCHHSREDHAIDDSMTTVTV